MTNKTNVTKLDTPLHCSICGNKIATEPLTGWAYGYNADPINDGRCCKLCDDMVVIPTRIRRIYAANKKGV